MPHVLQCRTCRVEVDPGDSYCSYECERTDMWIHEAHRGEGKTKPDPAPEPEETKPDDCVMYGLLTVADVIELERRRTLFALRQIVWGGAA